MVENTKEREVMDITYIEENFIRCTYCNDTKVVNSVRQHPCPRCNREEYKDWEELTEEEKDELGESNRGEN
jgi:hypothetical protein